MSMFESAMMLDALSGDMDREFPDLAREYRAKAAADPDRYSWSIAEADRRRRKANNG